MAITWTESLSAYRYPVTLGSFQDAHRYRRWFNFDLAVGDRANTLEFESHFRRHALEAIEPWLEVVFWKLYSQPARRNTVTAQAGQTEMTPDEIARALNKAYVALKSVKAKEEELAERPTVEKKVVKGKASIQTNKVICLECGKGFKQLTKSHLSSHALIPEEYKKKHGIPPGQALVRSSL